MRKKRWVVWLLIAVMLVAAGCQPSAPAETEATEATEAVEQTEMGTEVAGGMTAGTYEASAKGMNGDVKVSVEVDGSSIIAVNVLEHEESPGISDPAIEKIPAQTVEQQSVAVDTVASATVTSQAILDAAKAALEQSGADMTVFTTKKEGAAATGEKIEETADVVIIGAGGAGLAAAVAAAESGASVVILEKMPAVGGSTLLAGGQYNSVDKVRQEAYEMRPELIDVVKETASEEPKNDLHAELMATVMEQITAYEEEGKTTVFDSPELHALQTYKGGDYEGNLELILNLTKHAEESIPWLESLGVVVNPEIATVTGALWQRTHQFKKPVMTGPIDAYMEYINANADKVKIIFDAKAEKLVQEDGKITGVTGTKDGAEVICHANKGVIIATGGFARNQELVLKYDKHWGGLEGLGSTNAVSATGDGIIMGEDVGANLVGMEFIQLLPVGDPETGGMQGNISINAANQLFINKEGKRFVAEDERRDVLTRALMEQTDKEMFILHDAHEYTDENVKNDFNETIGSLVESGKVVKGESIEELATNMGVDPAALQATVDAYNLVVAGEASDEFGKNLVDQPFDKAPFYASKRVPTIHHTMGGLEINTDCQVLDAEGNPIPGLFAAGEVTGGIHGANRLGGNALPDTVVNGKIAGENAAK